jgi:hypothetical protein
MTGSQPAGAPHTFTADGYTTSCEIATFTTASQGAASSSITITPVYETCKTAGVASTVTMNGCVYKLDLTTTGIPNLATVSLVCTSGEVLIELGNPASPQCEIHVGPFSNKHHVKVANDHPGILTTATVSGIHAFATDTAVLCPFNGDTTVTNATYNGSVTFRGSAGQTIDIG